MSDVPLSAGERRPLWGRPEHRGHDRRDAEGAEDRPTPSAESRPASDEAADEAADVAAAAPNPEVEAAPVAPPSPPGIDAQTRPVDPARWTPQGYTPPAAWDLSGYAPPAPIRLEESGSGSAQSVPSAAGSWAALGPPGPLPPAAQPWPAFGPGAMPAPPSAIPAEPPVVVPAATPAVSGRRVKVTLRSSLTIFLFLVGVGAGIGFIRFGMPARPAPVDRFASLDRTAVEPVPASAVAQELARNDVHGLAQLLDSDTLTAIQTQLKPLVTFENVQFVGATSDGEDTIAGYVVKGRDQDRNLGLVGLVIRLHGGQVVAP